MTTLATILDLTVDSIRHRGVALQPTADGNWSLGRHVCHAHRMVHGVPHLDDQCKQTLSDVAVALGASTIHEVEFESAVDMIDRLRAVARAAR